MNDVEYARELSKCINTELLQRTDHAIMGSTLATTAELRAKAQKVIEDFAASRPSIALHRDDVYYLSQAIAEAFYVAPPIDPEEVEGVS